MIETVHSLSKVSTSTKLNYSEPASSFPSTLTPIIMSALNIEIKAKLDELQQALLGAHPTLPTLLRDIHRTLKAQPEQVTLMSEEEIHTVFASLEKQTNSYLAAAVTKTSKTSKSKESMKNVTSDDLGF